MTAAEYKAYEEAVAAFMAAEEITDLVPCLDCEKSFDWGSCDCCKSKLGGLRYAMRGAYCGSLKPGEYDVCSDCYYYAAYGVLDDETMLGIAAEDQAAEDELTYQREMAL